MVKEAHMKKMANWILPTVLMGFACVPGFSQIRVGLNLGPVSIRIAPDAPPAPRMEQRSARPSGNYVWIDGYWDRQDDRWAWAPGRWEEPGQPGSSWVKPQYRNEGGAYRFEPGHWSHQKMVEGDDYTRWHKEHKH